MTSDLEVTVLIESNKLSIGDFKLERELELSIIDSNKLKLEQNLSVSSWTSSS